MGDTGINGVSFFIINSDNTNDNISTIDGDIYIDIHYNDVYNSIKR